MPVAESTLVRPRFAGLVLTLLVAISATAFGATHRYHHRHHQIVQTHDGLPTFHRCHGTGGR